MPFVVALLKFLFDAYIRCHVGGDFASYIAGVQIYYDVVTLFISLKNDPHINLFFQIGENPPAIFSIGPFEFALLDNASTGHVCQYHVKLGDETQIVNASASILLPMEHPATPTVSILCGSTTTCSSFGGMLWLSYPSPEPDTETPLTAIAGCYV
jgi:hypothetical protein